MSERKKLKPTDPRKRVSRRTAEPEVNYFAAGRTKKMDFVSSGCSLFDNMLGGGYVLGRVVNLVGDKSTGKTLLAIESCCNFLAAYPEGVIRYAEAEAAFDLEYAAALGMPVDRVQFAGQGENESFDTVEDFYEDLDAFIDQLNGRPAIYILDSLDALSDRSEEKRKIDEGSYGGNKPKKLGELFRRLTRRIEESRVLLVIISQIRDKIGVMFGETKTRTGGRALDFYASQIVWLSEMGKMKKTVEGIDRIIGVEVKAKCKKNKIGLAFRECQFPVLFGYGIDDITAAVEWLLDIKQEEKLKELGFTKAGYKLRIGTLRNKGGKEVAELRSRLRDIVDAEWARIETSFLPQSKKY